MCIRDRLYIGQINVYSFWCKRNSSIALFSFNFITGASSGIGAGTAINFAKNGAKVAITGRNEENLKKIAQKCEEASPTKEKVLWL